jgi:hypothetical protein
MSAPWQLRPISAFNREVELNLLARAATRALTQWARDQHDMRMGIVSVIHTFGSDIKWASACASARHRGRPVVGRAALDTSIQAGLVDAGIGTDHSIHEAITYLQSHGSETDRMNYARARRLGLALGSGNVEATCKSLFEMRMKRVGHVGKRRPGSTSCNFELSL